MLSCEKKNVMGKCKLLKLHFHVSQERNIGLKSLTFAIVENPDLKGSTRGIAQLILRGAEIAVSRYGTAVLDLLELLVK